MANKLFALMLAVVVAACSKPAYAPPTALLPAPDALVETASGPVQGGRSISGAKTWLGIPYAQAPVGELRWAKTVQVQEWSQPRATLQHGNWCPQLTNGLDGLMGLEPGDLRGDEDCLYLDIYAPSDANPQSQLPVMVWIHGGSNIWGRAEQYDGSYLAESQDVVVVVVQYRLGPLGWFAHPALGDVGANFALMDLIEALEWVQSSVTSFGGNPENVTLFGESAGANNLLALLAMPQADGLYRAAIAQSGLPSSIPYPVAQNGLGPSVLGAIEAASIASGRDSPSAAELRQIEISSLFEAYTGKRTPAVIRDGVTLSAQPLGEAIIDHQNGLGKVIVLGSNRDEAKYLLAFDPKFTERLLGIFPKPRDRAHYLAVSGYMSDLWRSIGVSNFASDLANGGVETVHTYRFDWDEQGRVGPSDLSTMIGAAHSLEIPFVFGHFDEFMGRLDSKMFTRDNAPGRTALSDTMMRCWASIAYSEDRGCLDWPAVQSNQATSTMVFDTPDDGGVRMEAESIDSQEILQKMHTDPALQKGDRMCDLEKRLRGVFTIVAPDLLVGLDACQAE